MNNQEQNHKWIQVWHCEDGMEAQLIKNLMEINNIPVNLLNVNSNNMFPDSSIAEVTVTVPEAEATKAKKLIEENFSK